MTRPLALNEFPGSPGERVSVSIDYSGQLADGESINTAGTWTLPTGLTEVATSYTANSVTVIVDVSGTILAAGDLLTLELKNETGTDGNNTPEDCVLLRIEDC